MCPYCKKRPIEKTKEVSFDGVKYVVALCAICFLFFIGQSRVDDMPGRHSPLPDRQAQVVNISGTADTSPSLSIAPDE